MSSSPDNLPTSERIYCNSCERGTNHHCIAQHKYEYPPELADDYDPEVDVADLPREMTGSRTWICAGCDTATLQVFAGWVMGEGEEVPDADFSENHYVPPRHLHLRPENRYEALPKPIQTIYHEVILSLNNRLPLLCAMGIRALLEAICSDQQARGPTLGKMIDGLAPPIPVHIVQNLHELRFLGNEAAHELAIPETDDLGLAIGVCEDILNFFYQLDYRATQLAARRRARNLTPRAPSIDANTTNAQESTSVKADLDK